MPTVKDIVDYFNKLVPTEMKMDFDNVGLLVGINHTQVKKALITLDITDDVIDEAIRENVQIILSHHPLFFDLKEINDNSLIGRKVVNMLQNGISGFCQHTNLDSVQGGVNDALAERLGVHIDGWLDGPNYTADGKEFGMGRIGHIHSPVDFTSFLNTVKTSLITSGLRYYCANKTVYKVAVCGGSGGNYVEEAIRLGCDTLVTADIKYDRFLAAKELSLNLIDADHFCTENVVIPVLAEMVKKGFPEIDVMIANSSFQTVSFY